MINYEVWTGFGLEYTPFSSKPYHFNRVFPLHAAPSPSPSSAVDDPRQHCTIRRCPGAERDGAEGVLDGRKVYTERYGAAERWLDFGMLGPH